MADVKVLEQVSGISSDPTIQAVVDTHKQVRSGFLTPRLACILLAAKLGIDQRVAAEQLAHMGGLPDDAQRFMAKRAAELDARAI